MNRRVLIVAAIAFVANCVGFAAFLVLRPSQAALLHGHDIEWRSGSFSFSSGGPLGYVAARPLYQWNEWHGGERRWVKGLEIVNAPGVWVALRVANSAAMSGYSYAGSWAAAFVLLIIAVVQWLLVPLLLSLLIGRKAGAAN